MKRVQTFLFLLTVGLSALAQGSQSKPDFSGTWVFSPQKSSLKVPPPTSMTLQIEQKDPQISLVRKQLYGDQSFDWKLDAATDGQKEVVQDSPGYSTSSKVYWQGTALVIDSMISATDGTKISDVVTYSLEDGGKLLEGVERQTAIGGKGSAINKWVYEKK